MSVLLCFFYTNNYYYDTICGREAEKLRAPAIRRRRTVNKKYVLDGGGSAGWLNVFLCQKS